MNASADVKDWLAAQEKKELLRFLTCGSVDDGKSTLIGRLLYETQALFEDQLAALEADSKKHGTQGQKIDFATALKMPTRLEAIGRVVQLALSPAMRISGQLRGAGGVIAGQIKSISEKAEGGDAAPATA